MEYGMPTLIENKNLEETAQLCKALSLSFIELNMNLPMYQVEELSHTKEFLKIAEKYGIYYTIHFDENLNVCDFNSAVSEAYFETVRKTIHVAKQLQVPILNLHMNEGVYFTLPDEKVYLFEKYQEQYLKKMLRFREMCTKEIGESQIHICIENTNGYRTYQREAIELLLESSVFGLTWDIGHSHTHGDIDETLIMKHEDRLLHFHIHDALEKKNHLALGTGEINLKERLQVAEKNQCRCVLETKTWEALEKSVKWIKNASTF